MYLAAAWRKHQRKAHQWRSVGIFGIVRRHSVAAALSSVALVPWRNVAYCELLRETTRPCAGGRGVAAYQRQRDDWRRWRRTWRWRRADAGGA